MKVGEALASFVLVHGAWFGSWSWAGVTSSLRELGHEVIAVDLPGYGLDGRAASEMGFDDAVATVVAAVRSSRDAPVLVGHSRGGMVISAVAEVVGAEVERLVYVAAQIPVDGRSTFEIAAGDDESEGLATVAMSEDGTTSSLVPDRALLQRVYMADADDAAVGRAIALLEPEPTGFGTSSVALTSDGFGRLPKSMLITTADRALGPQTQRRLAERAGITDVHELDASHLVLLSRPADVVRLLVRPPTVGGRSDVR